MGKGIGRQRLRLHVQPERLHCGKCLGGGAIGEEHDPSHGQARVADGRTPVRLVVVHSVTRFWSRPYTVRATSFDAVTADGVRLRGDRLGGGDVALIFCHGFLGWRRKARLVHFQESLARWFTVYAFDLRGHGESEGLSAFGAMEHLDVDAVVRRARDEGLSRIVTLGGSMGGIAVIRHAALLGGVDAVVAISTPALWDGHDSVAVRRLAWLTASRFGRSFLRSAGVRAVPAFHRVEAPAELVGKIAPIPLVLVHGRDDHFFDEEQAWLLYRRAVPPKRLLMAARFGHAEDGYTPAFAEQIARVVQEVTG
jgi:pimeloyl-ACP methyl ester carboxylesterase